MNDFNTEISRQTITINGKTYTADELHEPQRLLQPAANPFSANLRKATIFWHHWPIF